MSYRGMKVRLWVCEKEHVWVQVNPPLRFTLITKRVPFSLFTY